MLTWKDSATGNTEKGLAISISPNLLFTSACNVFNRGKKFYNIDFKYYLVEKQYRKMSSLTNQTISDYYYELSKTTFCPRE